MANRDIKYLKPSIREKTELLKAACISEDFEILIYCTYRSFGEQARLYRRGRTLKQIQNKADELEEKWQRPDLAEILMNVGPQYGRVVTYAGPGQSLHNYGYAFDAVPMLNGKPVWGKKNVIDRELWHQYGKLGVSCGLEWAGNWKNFKEFPHMQEPNIDWRNLIGG